MKLKFFPIPVALLAVMLLVTLANPQDKIEKNPDQKAKQTMLEREATRALKQFKLKLEKEGFYSGRVALNVWRSTAIDAGVFDPEKFTEFKKQLYEKSIHDSMKCFAEFILEENFNDASICLQTWRIHSKELGTYDQTEYEALKETLTDAKTAKAAAAKTTEKPQD